MHGAWTLGVCESLFLRVAVKYARHWLRCPSLPPSQEIESDCSNEECTEDPADHPTDDGADLA